MDINDYIPSLLNPRQRKKNCNDLTQNSVMRRSSLSLKRTGLSQVSKPNTSNIGKVESHKDVNKENLLNEQNILQNPDTRYENNFNDTEFVYHRGASNFGFSDVDELADAIDLSAMFSWDKNISYNGNVASKDINGSFMSQSFTTDHKEIELKSNNATVTNKPVISQSFGVLDCKNVEVSSDNSKIKRTVICNKNNDTNVVCGLIESSHPSSGYGRDTDMDSSIKTSSNKVVVHLEIKNKLSREDKSNNLKVLILNTNYIRKLTNVTVHPLNYNSGKRKSLDEKNLISNKRLALECSINNENPVGSKKQKLINSYFPKTTKALSLIRSENLNNASNVEVMNKNSDIHKPLKTELGGRSFINKGNESPTSTRVGSSKRESRYSSIQEIKTSKCETRRVSPPSAKNDGSSSHSPRKNGESVYFNLPAKSKSNKTATSPKSIPHHKIVAGTHFAVDAFSYGDIPNVKHYFLSHFHSDHYSGLKKSFNKLLYCSKITADLCISRLSVSPKYINVINVAEPIRVEGVEVTAVNANHCPGAVMFIFTLPNGKTLLHTGDFRASPAMESYPIFWNRDIHTIYLDTTYCNPRYDFPTQDQSLEMALYILRQKKFVLEKSGKKFSSVLIVCGTYTIGWYIFT